MRVCVTVCSSVVKDVNFLQFSSLIEIIRTPEMVAYRGLNATARSTALPIFTELSVANIPFAAGSRLTSKLSMTISAQWNDDAVARAVPNTAFRRRFLGFE